VVVGLVMAADSVASVESVTVGVAVVVAITVTVARERDGAGAGFGGAAVCEAGPSGGVVGSLTVADGCTEGST
jgi:hypothetical protein